MSSTTIRTGVQWACAIAIAASVQISAPAAQAAEKLQGVVEMFTSQGCSSCPAADKILSNYAKENNILALSWHVDYWNYLGWKDTFSKPEFTDRQQRYAISFGRRNVYTPQAVINGRDHAVGSKRSDIDDLIANYEQSGRGLTVPVLAKQTDNAIRITADGEQDATLWVVYFDRNRKVKITRGENRGRTIAYHNVVREIAMLGMMKDGQIDVTLPLDELKRKGHDACAVILQKSTSSGTPGPIIGATLIGDL